MALQTSIIHSKADSVDVILKNTDIVAPYFVSHFKLLPPLHNAAYLGKKAIAETLLIYSFPINAKFSSDELTPLHLAVQKRHVHVIELLLKSGAEVNAKNVRKQTPLIMAILDGEIEIVQLLLKYGADSTQSNLIIVLYRLYTKD